MSKSEQSGEVASIITVSKEALLECCPTFAKQIAVLMDTDLDDLSKAIEESLDETLAMALEITLKQYLGVSDSQ